MKKPAPPKPTFTENAYTDMLYAVDRYLRTRGWGAVMAGPAITREIRGALGGDESIFECAVRFSGAKAEPAESAPSKQAVRKRRAAKR